MAITSTVGFLQALRQLPLLEARQRDELEMLQKQFPDPRALAARGLSMAEVMAFLEGIDLSRARRIAPVPASRVA